MTIEEFIKHQTVSGCLTMEDKQYLELRDVEKVLQMERERCRRDWKANKHKLIKEN